MKTKMRTEPYIVKNVNGVIIDWVMDISDDVELRIKRDYSGIHDDYRYHWSLHATSSKAGGGGFAIPADIPTTNTLSIEAALLEVKSYFECKARYYTPEGEKGFLKVFAKFPVD